MLNAPAIIENLRARSLQHWMLIAMGILGVTAIFWKASPAMLGFAYRAQGYEFLTQALEILGDQNPEPDYCVVGGIGEASSKSLINKAINALEAAQDSMPTDSQTLLFLGRAHCLSGNLAKATEAYQRYTELRPNNPLGHLELGFAYESACIEKNDVTEIYPGWQQCDNETLSSMILTEWRKTGVKLEYFVAKGDKALESEKYEEALLWFSRGNFIAPRSVYPFAKSGAVYIKLNKRSDAISFMRELVTLQSDNRDAWYELGWAYEDLELWEDALVAYENALSGSGSIGESYFYYRIGYLLQYKIKPFNFEAAWGAYESALQANTFGAMQKEKANTFYQRGILLIGLKRWDEAITEFQTALPLLPHHYWIRVHLAKAFWQIAETDLAKYYALEAISIQPENKIAYQLMGDILAVEGKHREAIDYYKKVLEIDPKDQTAKQALDATISIISSPQ